MVLEQLLNLKSVEKKAINVFFLGVVYTFIGIICARIIFPEYTGLMSVAFTSILLIPSLSFVLQLEENVEIREKKFALGVLFQDHKDIFKLYLSLFLGIFFAYAVTALVWPGSAIQVYFSPQTITAGISGAAVGGLSFSGILVNNLIVLVVCFVLSIIYGSGAVLFLTWNASVWGIVVGFFAKHAATVSNKSLVVAFVLAIVPILPHLVTEAASYVSAAIVGGVVSKAVIREQLFSKKFHHIITDAIILMVMAVLLIVVAAIVEVYAL
ncbi:MAG: stage II sporulation protein M [Candidatus Woesearchaeota archaeon]